jgi:acyl carrier protein
MSDEWICLTIGAVIIVIGLTMIARRERRQRVQFDRRRAERADQSPDEFAAECGDEVPSDVGQRVRRVCAKVSDLAYSLPEGSVEAARLRASDDVNADLGLDLDSLSIAHLYMELEQEFGIRLDFDAESLGIAPGTPVTVAHLTRAIVAQLKNPKPVLDDSFQPGFRISALDCLVLVAGAAGSVTAWQYLPWLGYSIACVVGHFFLFCNVVRMSRGLELAWSGVFLALTGSAIFLEVPWWSVAMLGTLAMTAFCVAMEMLRPSYHGIFWQRINPRLPEWWAASRSEK